MKPNRWQGRGKERFNRFEMKILLLSPVLLLLLTCCAPTKPKPKVMERGLSYRYADGSANVYEFRGNTVAYLPVTPAESSSGLYSGGDPKTVTIGVADQEKLVQLLEQALAATAQHQIAREKMTGRVEKAVEGSAEQSVVLRRDSTLKAEIELFLRALLK
jgi:hypothetical protein